MTEENAAASDAPPAQTPAPTTGPKVTRRPHNGWYAEQENLMADWADIAACYRWLHARTEKRYTRYNNGISIPVIILSTLTGSANIGMGSIFGDGTPESKIATLAIGGVSLIAGLLTTLNNFLRFAQLSESNKVASVAWGKFQRLLSIELAIAPLERMDSRDFLKLCRNELDRLIEQSPQVPDTILDEFQRKFGGVKNLYKPDICDHIEHTHIYIDKDGKLKYIPSESALVPPEKKRSLRERVEADMEESALRRLEEKRAIQERLSRGSSIGTDETVLEVDDDLNEVYSGAVGK